MLRVTKKITEGAFEHESLTTQEFARAQLDEIMGLYIKEAEERGYAAAAQIDEMSAELLFRIIHFQNSPKKRRKSSAPKGFIDQIL